MASNGGGKPPVQKSFPEFGESYSRIFPDYRNLFVGIRKGSVSAPFRNPELDQSEVRCANTSTGSKSKDIQSETNHAQKILENHDFIVG